MPLTWSHAVLQVRDLDTMLDYYTKVLGFAVSDRGPLGDDLSCNTPSGQTPPE